MLASFLSGFSNAFSESTLLNQNYVLDPEKSVKEIINSFPNEYSFKLIDYKLIVLS